MDCRVFRVAQQGSLYRSSPCSRSVPFRRASSKHIVSFADSRQAEAADAAPSLQTTETLPSGREIKKLEGFKPRRSVADLPEDLVKRLIQDNLTMKPPVKMGQRGVTKQVAEDIRRRWNRRDVVKVWASHKNCKGNMKEMDPLAQPGPPNVTIVLQETAAELERLTGGLVIWRSGAKVLIYKDPEGQKLWSPPEEEILSGPYSEKENDGEDDEEDEAELLEMIKSFRNAKGQADP